MICSVPARADGSHSDNIKNKDLVLELQSIESKSANACLLELYEHLLLDEHRVCCLRSTGIGHILLQNTIPMTRPLGAPGHFLVAWRVIWLC